MNRDGTVWLCYRCDGREYLSLPGIFGDGRRSRFSCRPVVADVGTAGLEVKAECEGAVPVDRRLLAGAREAADGWEVKRDEAGRPVLWTLAEGGDGAHLIDGAHLVDGARAARLRHADGRAHLAPAGHLAVVRLLPQRRTTGLVQIVVEIAVGMRWTDVQFGVRGG